MRFMGFLDLMNTDEDNSWNLLNITRNYHRNNVLSCFESEMDDLRRSCYLMETAISTSLILLIAIYIENQRF